MQESNQNWINLCTSNNSLNHVPKALDNKLNNQFPQLSFTNNQYNLLLSVDNYQFTDGDNDWDQNWLNVSMVLQIGPTKLQKVDPCLTTLELIDLKNWFEQLDGPIPGSNYFRFIEPCLSFEIVGDFLRIHLAKEFDPRNIFNGLDTTVAPINSFTNPFYMDFEWNELLRINAIHALVQLIHLFPSRGDCVNIEAPDYAQMLVI
jgi:hypothetical protein